MRGGKARFLGDLVAIHGAFPQQIFGAGDAQGDQIIDRAAVAKEAAEILQLGDADRAFARDDRKGQRPLEVLLQIIRDAAKLFLSDDGPPGYRKVLTDLIAHYGCYDTGDGTLPVLGLKYAALHDFGEDGSPELITLVNHKDADQQLHMTLRIYGCDGDDTVLRYTTELGTRYGQTDVSYTFTLGENFLATYHTSKKIVELD